MTVDHFRDLYLSEIQLHDMDLKNPYITTIIAGIIFVFLGISNIINGTTWWHYITFFLGLVIVGIGIRGYKNGTKIC